MKSYGYIASGELNDFLKERGKVFQEALAREERAKNAEQYALALVQGRPFPPPKTQAWVDLWISAISSLAEKESDPSVSQAKTLKEANALIEEEMIRLWYSPACAKE